MLAANYIIKTNALTNKTHLPTKSSPRLPAGPHYLSDLPAAFHLLTLSSYSLNV